ncbi:putative effector of murein hydrolase [Sphaerotilus hippei]|uniref:Putative effector of murein hydrolase n=1 Tax=Sphaerotilus hippei TaxID=744406 RepID=A0A318GVP8_9BURK|nr:LrgB family protein [Sphaerotilus hippei]PXW93297.1 putative effector of murein hydrolase [Sphaerotilus hippei]
MSEVVQLWVYLASSPLFGLSATLVAYVAAHALFVRLGSPPWANPVLGSVVILAAVLTLTATPYRTYFAGAQFVHVMLGPAVVAMGWPLWQRRHELRRRGAYLVVAATLGGAASALSAVLVGWLFGLDTAVLRSLAPKSVTAPVAMGIAERMGGVPALAAAFVLITGVAGALIGKYVLDAMRIHDWSVRGFALGNAAHGIGAARAMQVHADAGAYAGLALSLQALLASVLMPLAARWWG